VVVPATEARVPNFFGATGLLQAPSAYTQGNRVVTPYLAGTNAFFGGSLLRGEFDIALFAWTGSPLLTQGYATYLTKGAQNNGKYSNPQVDQLLKQLYSELNPTNQQRLLTELDRTLWSDLATMPLFAFPALLATAKNIEGVQYNPSASGVTFNVNDWSLQQ